MEPWVPAFAGMTDWKGDHRISRKGWRNARYMRRPFFDTVHTEAEKPAALRKAGGTMPGSFHAVFSRAYPEWESPAVSGGASASEPV